LGDGRVLISGEVGEYSDLQSLAGESGILCEGWGERERGGGGGGGGEGVGLVGGGRVGGEGGRDS